MKKTLLLLLVLISSVVSGQRLSFKQLPNAGGSGFTVITNTLGDLSFTTKTLFLKNTIKHNTLTVNYVPKAIGIDSLSNSQLFDDGSTVSIKGGFTADAANSSTKIFRIADVGDVPLFELNINGGLKAGIGAGNGATCADMLALGYHAAYSLSTTPTIGFGSVFLGAHAGEFSLAPSNGISIGEFAGKYSNADNNVNIGTSAGAGTSLYTGANNVFISASAGERITTGGSNIGIGYLALGKVTSSSFNIALGVGAGGYVNTYTGSKNISIGHNAGAEYSTATGNILIGHTAGTKMSTGNNNVFIGEGIGTFTGLDVSGDDNFCVGQYSGYSLNSGNFNTLLGVHVGQYVTSGSNNIFLGNNISNGANKISTGNGNILIGYDLDTPTLNPSNQLMIGSSLITGTFNAVPSNQTLSFNAVVNLPQLTASTDLALDASKNVVTRTDIDETFTVTGTTQALGNTPLFVYGIYLNGQRLINTIDYTISGNTITFTNPLASDKISAVYKY